MTNENITNKPLAYPGNRLGTLEEVLVALKECEEIRNASEKKFVEKLNSFWMDFPPTNGNPYSLEYRKHWMSVYEQIASKSYAVGNEFFDFDVDYHVKQPYPFCTQDWGIVSKQLMGIGKLIEILALPKGSSVLEMGAGWGNTSIFLAQMGYEVTVLDINPKFIELISKRASVLNVDLKFSCKSFEDASQLNQRFDCVLFFESFHHCHDHLALLDSIPNLLNHRGILALAGEPIDDNLPYDWDLNPMGEALWQIRTHGWLELSFRESYLIEALEKNGFIVAKYGLEGNPISTTFICHFNSY